MNLLSITKAFEAYSLNTLYALLPIALFYFIDFGDSDVSNIMFSLSCLPALAVGFYNFAKWNAWKTFVDEVRAQSYDFMHINKAAANSK